MSLLQEGYWILVLVESPILYIKKFWSFCSPYIKMSSLTKTQKAESVERDEFNLKVRKLKNLEIIIEEIEKIFNN